MRIAGIVCEFNPFHNGHGYLLQKVREDGYSHIAVCMSGSFTQRGMPAIYDKYSRTAAALKNGADIVLELPVSFACAGAERFAFGGVSVLDGLGCVERLYFGSESGDTERLIGTAEALDSDEFRACIKKEVSSGKTFAAARQTAIDSIAGKEAASVLSMPNDTLAVEYIKAIRKIGSDMQPFAVLRKGAAHNSAISDGSIASAMYIRELIGNGDDSYRDFIPESALAEYEASAAQPCRDGRVKALAAAMLYRLRSMSISEIAQLPEISEGLENRIYSAVRVCGDIDSIIGKVKTKRYTYARIRRILNYALLHITSEEYKKPPAYIRVLGFNDRGKEILSIAGKTAKLPIAVRSTDIKDEASVEMFRQECYADDIFALTCRDVLPCGRTMTEKPVII